MYMCLCTNIWYIVRQLEGHYSTLSSMEPSILWSQSHCKFWPILINFLFCFIYVAIKTTFSAASKPKDKYTILLFNVNFISRTIHQPCRMYKEICIYRHIFILLFSLTIPSCLSLIIYTQDVDTNIWYFQCIDFIFMESRSIPSHNFW